MKRKSEPYKFILGANSDPENLAKLAKVYNRLKARLILKELENDPEAVQEEVLKRIDTAEGL